MIAFKYYWPIAILIGFLVFFLILEFLKTKCPSCGRFFAKKILKQKVNGYEFHIEDKSYTQKYSFYCKCKYCGYEWTQKDNSEIK
jgi:hypothetical protein